jgi:hypothetical protein
MTDIILLEGPDGNRYKGTQISEGCGMLSHT